MQTARFEQIRKRTLDRVFDVKQMVKVWRIIVRDQLREQDIKDLFDYFDFNFTIKERAQAIRASILNGDYKSSTPLVYRIEKKFGVSRHMVIPQATDALIMQVLIESVTEEVLKNQPSKKAFYSRSKHKVLQSHETPDYSLHWRAQWLKLQKLIYKFSSEKDLIVTTDLSNYYDSIDIRELKKVFTSYLKSNSEVTVDILFGIIENISWHPDYLPYSSRGLPTSNLEAIRLLAHSFLFEVDEVLQEKTGDCFTRWMDDIVIGVDTKKEARETISAISDMLKSRGLALNLAKTNIYDPEEAIFNFQIEDNAYISSIKIIPKTDLNYNSLTTELRRKFKEHNKNNKHAKAWDKVAKRYITQFSKLKSEKLLSEVVELYLTYPVLRASILAYLQNLGYKKSTSNKVLDILGKIDIFDDISLYQICNLVTQWEVSDDNAGRDFLRQFEDKITKFSFSRKNSLDFYCLLWFKSKYSRSDDLLTFLNKYKNLWQSDSFLRRQATAVLARVYPADKEKVRQILQSQVSSGESNTVSLANQLQLFLDLKSFDGLLNFYLFPPNKIQRPYPLSKFLVLCSVLNSEDIRTNPDIRRKILDYIFDPYYLKWLDYNYGIS